MVEYIPLCKTMKLTTLCYLEKDGCYLVMHRNKKEHDENGG